MAGREFLLDVRPRLPGKLARLEELAENLWYSWHRPSRALFGGLAPAVWEEVGHNAKLFLRRVDQAVLDRAAEDPIYLGSYHAALLAYDTYHDERSRVGAAAEFADDDLIAYFCAEYGLHEGLVIYSGGLGILAGHHCKTASDLRLPFVAVGLLYRTGYFAQAIDGAGNQIASYTRADFDSLPIRPANDVHGDAIRVGVAFPGRTVYAKVWEACAGHVRLFLLDTDIDANSDEDRQITSQLYGGGVETRIRQELILGIGGVRALRRLDLAPTVWHINEGHPAFSALERIRERCAAGQMEPRAALEAVAAGTVFTTHTPVPAGHDHFPHDLLRPYLQAALPELDSDWIFALGRVEGDGPDLNMTTLALRAARHRNGVSRLHGEISARMCAGCWPQIEAQENPIGHVTNGVHIATILAQGWVDLFDRVLGIEWHNRLLDRRYWHCIHAISDQLFWGVKQSIKANMLATVSHLLRVQLLRNQVSEPHVDRILRRIDQADPNVLTIGFARRFATYKRSTLLFHDLDRLRDLLGDGNRPVVLIYAGKAHPADEPGRALLKRVHEVSCMPEFLGKVLLIEGYDLALARRLIPGVDVWLNTPVYGREASGTSGMKAAVNGVINLSVTDGWWAEGYEGDNGWAIRPSPHPDPGQRDAEDARTLYEILEDQVIPLYYSLGRYGFSPEWVALAKRSMASILPRFNMNRVLDDYTRGLYVPAAHQGVALASNDGARALELAQWRQKVESAWPKVGVRLLATPDAALNQGDSVILRAAVQLSGLRAQDVAVELVLDRRATDTDGAPGEVRSGQRSRLDREQETSRDRHPALTGLRRTQRFEPTEHLADSGEQCYELSFTPGSCGQLGYRIRAYPTNPLLAHPFETGLMRWVE